MSDVVPPQIPLVLHLLLTDLAVHLPPNRVHVEDVLWEERDFDIRHSGKMSGEFFVYKLIVSTGKIGAIHTQLTT